MGAGARMGRPSPLGVGPSRLASRGRSDAQQLLPLAVTVVGHALVE
jgi:hypothetical protein